MAGDKTAAVMARFLAEDVLPVIGRPARSRAIGQLEALGYRVTLEAA